MCLSRLVMLPSLLLCCLMFKGDLKKFNLYSQHSLCVSTFESVLWLLNSHHSKTMFWVSCRRCGTHHGPPLTRLFLSTSTHLLGISLRNKSVPWYQYTSTPDVIAFDNRFTSLTFDQKIQSSAQHQSIYSHSEECTNGTLGIVDINGDFPFTC